MSTVETTNKVNAAIHDCLNVCYNSHQPVLALTEYLKGLWSSGEWTAVEVAKIRSATVHILRSVAAPEEDDGMPLGYSLEFRG